ncbi:helix-turn-helix domain-containing protein [Acidaminococcus massiliensis]
MANANIFRLKNSVEKVAGQLGISKNTVYLHLRKIRKDKH